MRCVAGGFGVLRGMACFSYVGWPSRCKFMDIPRLLGMRCDLEK